MPGYYHLDLPVLDLHAKDGKIRFDDEHDGYCNGDDAAALHRGLSTRARSLPAVPLLRAVPLPGQHPQREPAAPR